MDLIFKIFKVQYSLKCWSPNGEIRTLNARWENDFPSDSNINKMLLSFVMSFIRWRYILHDTTWPYHDLVNKMGNIIYRSFLFTKKTTAFSNTVFMNMQNMYVKKYNICERAVSIILFLQFWVFYNICIPTWNYIRDVMWSITVYEPWYITSINSSTLNRRK